MELLGAVTAGWAILMALSPILQIRRMLGSRSSASVSVGYFGLLCVGFALWVAYGATERSAVLVAPNSAALVVGLVTIAVALRLRGSPGRRTPYPPDLDTGARGRLAGSGAEMKARVEWDGHSWAAEPEGERGVTQAKRLDQLPARLSEVAHLMTGETIALEDWDLAIHLGDLGDQAAALRRQRAELDAAEQQLAARTRETAQALRSKGVSLRDIGSLLGVPLLRVHQLVR